MKSAEKFTNRYRAVAARARGAVLKLSALDAWARQNDWPVNIAELFRYVGEGESPPEHRHYVDFIVVGMKVADAFGEAADDHAIAEYAQRLGVGEVDRRTARTVMMAEVDYRILCAVYDGELMLYDQAGFPIDVTAERLEYDASPEAYMPPDFPPSETPEKRLGQQRSQEEAILRHLGQHGWTARALPRAEAGKRGVKAAVRSALSLDRRLFRSAKTFDMAWERLRQSGEIADQPESATRLPRSEG
ncbi:Uncharacterised protein [Burkholderia pseudomallei]|uniref:hypothetical protein n=1 Tax=Burkholderia pseudomallei TaxID=28450 RepID=UPI0005DCEFAB|nr:hypothetical protein [Burkholderia pseudomallei]QUN86028.1 hypothetical protein KEX46_14310 [Burkholderia pseudomallei]CPH56379.1 Uncharacterised protein [Burkholderia pseudomallei]